MAEAQLLAVVHQFGRRDLAQQVLLDEQTQAGIATRIRVADLVVLTYVEEQTLAGVGHRLVAVGVADVGAALGEGQRRAIRLPDTPLVPQGTGPKKIGRGTVREKVW